MANKILKGGIAVVGLFATMMVAVLNIIIVADLDKFETVNIKITSLEVILITAIICALILALIELSHKLKLSKKAKIIIISIALIIYVAGQMVWVTVRQKAPAWDQQFVYVQGERISQNDWEKKGLTQYIERHPYQLSLATMYALIFKLVGHSSFLVIQYANCIANGLTIVALLLIADQLRLKSVVDKRKLLIISMTFLTLPLLSVFIYGDYLGLATSLFSVYFIMKYAASDRKINLIISAIFMAVAVMFRKNNLIFIIAVEIYLLLKLLEGNQVAEKNAKIVTKKNGGIDAAEAEKNAGAEKANLTVRKPDRIAMLKRLLVEIAMMFIFAAISILPQTITIKIEANKLGLDLTKQSPTSEFLLMGMSESYRGNGWYAEGIANRSWADPIKSDEQDKAEISKRQQAFKARPAYAINFYMKKIESMWCENTYGGIFYNKVMKNEKVSPNVENIIKNLETPLMVYQRALILIEFGSAVWIILNKRHNLSNEEILLLTIFLGGFFFHILWEAKSRYILPYIIAFMPFAAVKNEVKEDVK